MAAGEAAVPAERVLQRFARDREDPDIGSSDSLRGAAAGIHADKRLLSHSHCREIPQTYGADCQERRVPSVQLGIVKEIPGKHMDRLFAYSRYLNIAIEGTEPLSNR